ncbi:MAG: phosphatase PAP2 family protein [Piscinibacter sp.]
MATATAAPTLALDHRRAGDILENALPAGAAAIELWRGDTEGLWQLGASFTVTLLATQALKKGLDVQRPDGGVESFPSGHAAKAFAAATYMHRRHGLDSAWPWYVAAGYVGWTRVNAHRHRWGDVAGSALLAGLSSRWLVTPAGEAGVSLLPSVGPGGVFVELQARW